jgi:hypothetical protein
MESVRSIAYSSWICSASAIVQILAGAHIDIFVKEYDMCF